MGQAETSHGVIVATAPLACAMIKPSLGVTAAYDISATGNDYFPIKSSAPPSCPNWTVFTHEPPAGCDLDHRPKNGQGVNENADREA